MSVKAAVFPVAGRGSRFMPATKAVPKEMLPVIDKPLIQYAVEEAVAAGITTLIFITNASKQAIADHFSTNLPLRPHRPMPRSILMLGAQSSPDKSMELAQWIFTFTCFTT